jgi:peptidoglycan-N-acetylglucosamine deacetylase
MRSRTARRLRIAGICLVALLVGAYAAWRVSGARTFQLLGSLVSRVDTSAPLVAMTFDDGPTPFASDTILAILAREGVRATFFFTGAEMADHLDLAPRFVHAGHELGNHTYSHRQMLLRSAAFIRAELDRTDSLIRDAGHRGAIHFRPPYGRKLVGLPWQLARSGRITVMWDVEPDSYPEVASSADSIIAHVLENARPGSIILLHVMYASRTESLRAVEGIIHGLRDRGFAFVTLSELLAAP